MTAPFISLGEKVVHKAEQSSNVCSQCGRECPNGVGMTNYIKLGSRWVTWRECGACYFEQEKRAMRAIEVAERAGV